MYNQNENEYDFTVAETNPQKPPKKKSKVGKVIATALAFILLSGGSGYLGATLAEYGNKNDISTEDIPNAVTQNMTVGTPEASSSATIKQQNPNGELSIPAVIAKAQPSVVKIEAKYENANGQSLGTGFFITDDGYVVTNAHVVETEFQTVVNNDNYYNPFEEFFGNYYGGQNIKTISETASEIIITTQDDKEYEAEVIGVDTLSDLAVLKIEGNGFSAIPIGKSEGLLLGETTVAIGYPLGLGLSTSEGTVSGLDRTISIDGDKSMNLIQTTAAINSGNSGGPLLNNNAQIIGIVSSKIASEQVDGVGFAIPIDRAIPIIEELMTTGEVKNTSPKIGITGTEINSSTQRYYNLPVEKGILVMNVEAGSAAEQAGLVQGDVIVAADGEDCFTMDKLNEAKNSHKAGETMTLTLARADKNLEVTLTLTATDE